MNTYVIKGDVNAKSNEPVKWCNGFPATFEIKEILGAEPTVPIQRQNVNTPYGELNIFYTEPSCIKSDEVFGQDVTKLPDLNYWLSTRYDLWGKVFFGDFVVCAENGVLEHMRMLDENKTVVSQEEELSSMREAIKAHNAL